MKTQSSAIAARQLRLAGLVLAVVALVGLAWLLHLMPAGHWSRWGGNPLGIRHFANSVGLSPQPMSTDRFVRLFRAALLMAWAGYGIALVAAWRARTGLTASVRRTLAVVAFALAVILPPALSCDVYAYTAYARMPLVHGWNPYTQTQFALSAVDDPTAPFLQADVASPYGPLWTLLSLVLVAPLTGAPLVLSVLGFKLLAATGLVATAAATRRLAERLTPGRGDLAFIAVVACPLLAIEGPGSGHNDLVAVAFLVAGAAAWQRDRVRMGVLLVGAAAAIKLVMLPAVALVAVSGWGTRTCRERFALLALGLVPLGLAWLPFGIAGQHAAVLSGPLAHAGAGHGGISAFLVGSVFLFGLIWAGTHASGAAWHLPWIALAAVLALIVTRIPFPWYLAWTLSLALARWRPRDALVTIALLVVAVLSTFAYTTPH